AGSHEQAVALGAAEADIAADLRETDAPDELALRGPDRHAAVAHGAAGIARAPQIAVDVAAHTVRPALHPIDHEVAEQLLVGELIVVADVEYVQLAAVWRVSKPVASVRMGHDVVGRIEPLAIVRVCQHCHRAVMLIAHEAPGEVLTGELATLEVERIAIAIVRRLAKDRHAPIV